MPHFLHNDLRLLNETYTVWLLKFVVFQFGISLLYAYKCTYLLLINLFIYLLHCRKDSEGSG